MALVLIVFCLYFLAFDDSFFGLFADLAKSEGREQIGEISYLNLDVRHKLSRSIPWKPAQPKENVHWGDSVFSGAHSQAQVTMKDGSQINLGENTLILFSKDQNVGTPNLKIGNFRIAVDGDLKVAIKDQVTHIKGRQSEIQIVVTEKKEPVIRILKGEPEIQKTGEVVSESVPASSETVQTKAPGEEVLKAEPASITALQTETVIHRTDRLYDLYERVSDGLERRDQRISSVPVQILLKWKAQGNVQTVFGEISSTSDFSENTETFSSLMPEQYLLTRAHLGENFWRISMDSRLWSDPLSFRIESAPLAEEPPRLQLQQMEMVEGEKWPSVHIALSSGLERYVLEISSSPEFEIPKTQTHWLGRSETIWSPRRPGTYYFRSRAVNDETELTEYSSVETFTFNKVPGKAKLNLQLTESTLKIRPQPRAERTVASALPEEPEPRLKVEMESVKPSVPDNKVYWLWMGIGAGFQYYQQSVPNYSGDAKFRNISAASYRAQGGVFGDNWGGEMVYSYLPWNMSSTESSRVSNGSSSWQTVSAETLYRTEPSSTLNYRIGVQHHLVPFMYSMSADGDINVQTNTLTMALVGFEKYFNLANKYRFDWMMRYQYPVVTGTTSGSDFKIKPRFAFDGSIGTAYLLSPRSKFGLYWYGQWHDYQFDYFDSSRRTFSGNQILFFSNVEFRYGIDF